MLCLDPGGVTGVAIIDYDNNNVNVTYFGQVEDGLDGFISWYKRVESFYNWDFVVCESFTLRPSVKFPDLSPVYIIGALTALQERNSIIYQQPQQKPLCDDSRLKSMGFYKPGLGHANDAIRHGIIYLRNNRHMPTLKKGWATDEL
jgi:hypothetical protein